MMRERLQQRARLLDRIRSFMTNRNILEVTTPCITDHPVSDVHIESVGLATAQRHYLRTSPESCHKKLLAQGLGDLYEMGPVFRANEAGRHHQGEFTLLEWYRLDFDWQTLALEVVALINDLTDGIRPSWPRVFRSWDETTETALGFNLRTATRGQCLDALSDPEHAQTWSDEILVDYLYATQVQSQFDPKLITVVHDYPASQAALAQLSDDGVHAKRFEVFIGPVELANGYQELTDPQEQRARFEQDLQHRHALGRSTSEIDQQLLEALEMGLPPCSGVALGVDRLIMVLLGFDCIDEILAMPRPDAIVMT